MVMGPAFMPFLLGINGYVQITRGKNRRNHQRCGTLNSYRPLRYITGEQIFSHIFIKKRKIIVKIFSNFNEFVCLEFIVLLKIFSLIWRRHNCRWRAANSNSYARHSWLLISESSLTCHTYCDTGLPFTMVTSEDPWHSHLLPSVWQWSCHYLFLTTESWNYWTPVCWMPSCERNM